MIFYEVNLEIDQDIYKEYLSWLKDHIQKMLSLKGFVKAQIYEVNSPKTSSKTLSVVYEVDSRESLENYFKVDADRMRSEGVERFNGKFKAGRRVLTKI